MNRKAVFAIALFLVFVFGFARTGAPSPGSENIALGKKYTFSHPPSYPGCTDPYDNIQLTDGIYTGKKGAFWTQKSTVGWSTLDVPVYITIDLKKIYPISGLSYNTAGGTAGVYFPVDFLLFASDDGKSWYEASDFLKLSARKTATPQSGKKVIRKFRTDELKTHGRFLQLVIKPEDNYVFVDEIEVFRGPETFLKKPHSGERITDVAAFAFPREFNDLIKAQLRRDLKAVFEDIGMLVGGRDDLRVKANILREKIGEMLAVSAEGFTGVLPMIDLERDIFKLQAEVWRAQGKPLLKVWKTHRWDPLEPSQEPAGKIGAAVDISMMNNAYRADVFNLTNADDRDKVLRFQIQGLPGGINPDYITVHQVLQVLAVGTRESKAVSTALSPAEREGNDYLITVPSGMTRQVWMSFHPEGMKPGAYKGNIVVKGDLPGELSIPVWLEVSSRSRHYDWPVWRHNPALTGRTTLKGNLTTTPVVSWRYPLTGMRGLLVVHAENPGQRTAAKCHEPVGRRYLNQWGRKWGIHPFIYKLPNGKELELSEGPSRRVGRINPDLPEPQEVVFTGRGRGKKTRCSLSAWDRPDGKRRQVWSSPGGNAAWERWNICFGDIDGDGIEDIIIAGHGGVMVYDPRSGKLKCECKYGHRSRGFIGMADIDNDGRDEFLDVGLFQIAVEVCDYKDGKMSILWNDKIELNIMAHSRIINTPFDALCDIDGDGKYEVIYNMYNHHGDGEWHLVIRDALTGQLRHFI